MHRDLQLKNMMVDKAADKLLLVDFEEADRINEVRLQQEFNQLTWSIYELVTHDVALVEESLELGVKSVIVNLPMICECQLTLTTQEEQG